MRVCFEVPFPMTDTLSQPTVCWARQCRVSRKFLSFWQPFLLADQGHTNRLPNICVHRGAEKAWKGRFRRHFPQIVETLCWWYTFKALVQGLKGPLSQTFPTKCGNVVLMIHFWLLSNLSEFQGYPESVSWWRQLQKTKSLSWIYWCITSRPWRSKRPCSERPQILTSSTTIATATHWWIGNLVNTNLLVPTLPRLPWLFLYLLLGMPILTIIGVM